MRLVAIGLALVLAGCGGGEGTPAKDGGAGADSALGADGATGDAGARDGAAGDGAAGDAAPADGAAADVAVALDASAAPVATVTVTAPSAPMVVGAEATLTATLRDAGGALLTGRAIAWSSSAPARMSVSAGGVVHAFAPGGPVVITATSEGVPGSVALTIIDGVATGIADVYRFLERCPGNDPAYATIRADFQLRADDVPITGDPPCTEPYLTVPLAQLTDELYVLQALRIAYYLSPGTEGFLPWTPLGLYPWLHTRAAGINLKSAPNQLYCCDQLDGKLFFAMSRQSASSRDSKRDWPGLSSSLAFIAHEVRHADPGPGHTNGCPAFPLPTSPYGCDQTYDLANLGSYGVQYWLESSLADGSLYIGIPCAPTAVAQAYLADAVQQANGFIDRFVTNPPPTATTRRTYGGPCPP
ncbi:MAG: Ig-like domain-containing protein [Deltaproteobacteria bacterium]|nr:Ig-like domain-containing protein [Deltaproteobacteria bacterium]